MKFHTEYLWFNTKKHREFINITPEVEKALVKSKIQEGFALVSAMHITAAVYVNDAESGLIRDIEEWYISTVMRQGYIREVFARQAQIAIENDVPLLHNDADFDRIAAVVKELRIY